MPIIPNATGRIDLGLLDEVEQRLQELMDSSAKFEIAEPDTKGEQSALAWESMDAHLAGWQDRLEDLSRQTAELEQELTAQEQSLRKWFEALDARKKLLQRLAS